jgi:hypothetical protein
VPFILTLDRPLAAEIGGMTLGPLTLSPVNFVTSQLPTHPSFKSLREDGQVRP